MGTNMPRCLPLGPILGSFVASVVSGAGAGYQGRFAPSGPGGLGGGRSVDQQPSTYFALPICQVEGCQVPRESLIVTFLE